MNNLLNKPTIHSVIFWGEKNRELFFNIGLPSILASGNLDKKSKHIFYLITTAQDEDKIKYKNSFKILKKRAKIKIVYINDCLTPVFGKPAVINVKYVIKTINRAFNLKCGHFTWSADCVVSNNLFLKINEKIEQGYQGIGSTGDYINYNKKTNNFFKKINKKGIIDIKHKDLIKFVSKNEGVLASNNLINNKFDKRSQCPSGIVWKNSDIKVAFSHKFHALFLIPQKKITNEFIGSADHALATNVIDLKKYYILNSFTQEQARDEAYNKLNDQDPGFYSLSDIKKSLLNIHHLNGRITPKIMAHHWNKNYYKDEKYLINKLIIFNHKIINQKLVKKKIILLNEFRRKLFYYFYQEQINPFYYINNIYKKILFFFKRIIRSFFRLIIKIFNFFINKI